MKLSFLYTYIMPTNIEYSQEGHEGILKLCTQFCMPSCFPMEKQSQLNLQKY